MASDPPRSPRSSRVPHGRFSRVFQLGTTVSRMAVGGAAEKLKRWASEAEEALPSALLTVQNAKLLAERLSRLRGAAMKVGQMLSMEGDHLLPAEFAQALEVLRSSAHRMPAAQVKEVLEKELGAEWRSRFGSFQMEAIASASIGQVHQATTLSGQKLALKIQYPGVAESIESDVDNLRSLIALTRIFPRELDFDELTEALKEELRREVDYERELRQLLAYKEQLGEMPGVFVPQAFPELSTARILALEWCEGVELLSWAKEAPQEERDQVATRLIQLVMRELFEMRLMQTDPNPANYLYDAQAQRLVLLDFGAARLVPEDTMQFYRQALTAMVHRDDELLQRALQQLGVEDGVEPEASALLRSLILETSEIFDEEVYDFQNSTLLDRLKQRGKALRPHQKSLRPPPPAYLFFQRKLGGTFLLCRQLGARVGCRAIVREFID